MTIHRVVMVAAVPPARPAVLREALERYREAGARIVLVCDFDPSAFVLPPGIAEVHALDARQGRRTAEDDRGARLPARATWHRARSDRWVIDAAQDAALLVAVDLRAVHTVWQLARRNRRAYAVNGIIPGLRALESLGRNRTEAATERRAPRLRRPARVARRWIGRLGRRVRNQTTALGLPWRPDLRWPIRRRMTTSLGVATDDIARRAGRVRDPARRADELGRACEIELDAGSVPPFHGRAVDARLAVADAAYVKGNLAKAARQTARLRALLFHRGIHIDSLDSPLTSDAEGYLAAFHASAVGGALAHAAGRRAPAQPPPGDRAHRLLVVTWANANFLGEILARYRARRDIEVRFLDLGTDPVRQHLSRTREIVSARLAAATGRPSAVAGEVEDWLRPHLTWADTVFVEWCNVAPAIVSLVDPGRARVIVRLHSYEALTMWPHLVDLSRIDDLVFVAAHVRDLAVTIVPRLRQPGAPRLRVLPNAIDLARFRLPKVADARFTVAMIGVRSVVKDPCWAFEVIRLLRREDPRHRLLLVGADFDATTSAAAAAYDRRYRRELEALEAEGAVVRHAFTADVPGVLRQAGVLLSSSVREGAQQAVIEGAASGAVPVVRDWPFFAGRPNSARSMLPSGWVVATPDEAAARILGATATEAGWRTAGAAASEHALATWDWGVVAPAFDRLFLDGVGA